MLRKTLITSLIVAALTSNVSAADKSEYQKLEDRVKKLEVQFFAASVTNASAIELLCRETHPAEYCTDLYQKAAKRAQGHVDEFTKEIAASPNIDSKPTSSRVVITGKWKDISLWRRSLAKGMTHEQVRSTFGEPDKIDSYSMIGDVWHYGYPVGGRIDFGKNGFVSSWSEPHLK